MNQLITSLFVFVSSISIAAASDAPVVSNSKVTQTGILNTHLVGLGSETTGIGIETSDGIRELVFSADFQKRLGGLEDKLIQVRGKKVTLHGTETGNRDAIEVSRVVLYPKLSKLTGTFVQDAAIGGETTGYRLETDDKNSIELVLTEFQQRSSKKYLNKKISVEGMNTKLHGIEIPSRAGFLVESFIEQN